MNPPRKYICLIFIALLMACFSSAPTSVSIPAGMRAVSVHTSEKVRFLKGARVDVVSVDNASRHLVLVEDVAVVAVDKSADTVTVIVNKQQNEQIMTAAAENEISLVSHGVSEKR